MIYRLISFLTFCYILNEPTDLPQINEVRTYGSFETGGIDVQLINYTGSERIQILYKEKPNKNSNFEGGLACLMTYKNAQWVYII